MFRMFLCRFLGTISHYDLYSAAALVLSAGLFRRLCVADVYAVKPVS